jgi:hypothetical protein
MLYPKTYVNRHLQDRMEGSIGSTDDVEKKMVSVQLGTAVRPSSSWTVSIPIEAKELFVTYEMKTYSDK